VTEDDKELQTHKVETQGFKDSQIVTDIIPFKEEDETVNNHSTFSVKFQLTARHEQQS
jgi:hypothetical protein